MRIYAFKKEGGALPVVSSTVEMSPESGSVDVMGVVEMSPTPDTDTGTSYRDDDCSWSPTDGSTCG